MQGKKKTNAYKSFRTFQKLLAKNEKLAVAIAVVVAVFIAVVAVVIAVVAVVQQ